MWENLHIVFIPVYKTHSFIHSFSNFWISNIVRFSGVWFLIHCYLYLWLHCDSGMSLVTCRWCETFPSVRCVYNIPLGPQTVNREPGPTRRWISMHNVCIRHTRQHYTSALHYNTTQSDTASCNHMDMVFRLLKRSFFSV